ncbi:MAG: hypothetical protein OEM60_12375 [Gammaproteobacteria bacterium]|nr:hypothetical protein [Gammaproteobacteria bacterium]MDH3434652.1 hypothetical protein [Gammaproteobacteria bacterium]
MTRLRLFRLRTAATIGLLLLLFAAVRLLWYPGGYFAVFGVGKLFLILATVMLVIGPGLSVFVFKAGKKGLTMDLWLLASVEFAAAVAAMSILYVRQPYFTVFAVDRFEAVSWREVDVTQIGDPTLRRRPGHAPRLVYAELPTDPEVFDRLIDETVFGGMQDIDRRPEFWKPYSAGIPAVKAAAKPLDELLRGDDSRASRLARWLSRQAGSSGDFVYLPVRGRGGDATMILHAEVGFPVAIVDVDPW